MAKSNADYQKAYRARKKAQTADPSVKPMKASWNDVKAAMDPDSNPGPRSNYYSDPHAPGGWGETIRNMSNEQANHILDRIVTKRPTR